MCHKVVSHVSRIRYFSKKFPQTEKFLLSNNDTSAIPWNEVETAVNLDHAIENIGPSVTTVNAVLNSCINLCAVDHCRSFYDYLKSKNIKLNVNEFYLILLLLSQDVDLKKIDMEFLNEVFENVKPYFFMHNALFEAAAKALFTVPKFWKEMMKINEWEGQDSSLVRYYLGLGAFTMDLPDLGWSLLEEKNYTLKIHFVSIYIKYCLINVKNGTFTPDLITKFVDFYNKKLKVIPEMNTLELFCDLINMLNSNKGRQYIWSVNSTKIGDDGICTCCTSRLPEASITQEDIKVLKKHFLRHIIIDKNVNMRTSQAELDRFSTFLKHTQKYNTVIDGLNIIHNNKNEKQFSALIKYCDRHKKNVLLIARHHFKFTRMYQSIKDKWSVFLTDNISEDDVYVIYSALHGGKGTFFFTSDLLRGYAKKLNNPNLQEKFLIWQFSHQYMVKDCSIIPPKSYEFLPSTIERENENGRKTYFWHLPLSSVESRSVRLLEGTNWLCLKAVPIKKPRNRLRKSNTLPSDNE
ncbi:hypothetical protein RUM44_004659 [Polyplax serrata]|uniref:PRORP domain-containing protein n=1 Tax=Polyplax serrata TaxID=468196 RepID=A0ABR1B473_POLSC